MLYWLTLSAPPNLVLGAEATPLQNVQDDLRAGVRVDDAKQKLSQASVETQEMDALKHGARIF